MIQFIKSLLKPLIPETYRADIKIFLKRFRYFGSTFYCPVCKSSVNHLQALGYDLPVNREKQIIGGGPRNAMCPVCGSSDRERLLYLFIKQKTTLFTEKTKLLHLAPERNLKRIISKHKNIVYLTADLNPVNVMEAMDITQIKYPNNSFDAIICNHVLEHIPNDQKAMQELFRVLKPGGWAILQVPVSGVLKHTFEDFSITTPGEREKIFGQKDHVRIYAKDYSDRLKSAGFKPEEFHWETDPGFGGEQENKFVLYNKEVVYFCMKGF